MTLETKCILQDAIYVYKNANTIDKKKYMKIIDENLLEHQKCLDKIGMGLSAPHVQAALIFKRVFKFY